MKLDAEPRLSSGPSLYQSLIDWARKVVQAVNERATLEYLTAGFLFSSGGNGYLQMPAWMGGVIIQWGRTPLSSGTIEVGGSFPLTFPNAMRAIVFQPDGSALGTYATLGTVNTSAYGYNVWLANGTRQANVGSYFIAVGS